MSDLSSKSASYEMPKALCVFTTRKAMKNGK